MKIGKDERTSNQTQFVDPVFPMSDISNLAIKALSKRFENVNVQEQLQAVKLVYEADRASSNKDEAFQVYKTALALIPRMDDVIARCDERMREVRTLQKGNKSWEVYAQRTKANKKGTLELEITLLQKEIAQSKIKLREATRIIGGENPAGKGHRQEEYEEAMSNRAELQQKVETLEAELASAGVQLANIESNVRYSAEEIKAAQAMMPEVEERTTWLEAWNDVLRRILGRILDVEMNTPKTRISREWKMTCERRVEACVMHESPLQLAQDLRTESYIFNWGMEILLPAGAERETEMLTFAFDAHAKFLHTGGMRKFNIPTTDWNDSKGCLEKLVQHLKRDAILYGTEGSSEGIVAATSRVDKKHTRLIDQSFKSGSYEELTERRRPLDDDEEAHPLPPKKHKPAPKPAEPAEPSVVAAVRPAQDPIAEQTLKVLETLTQKITQMTEMKNSQAADSSRPPKYQKRNNNDNNNQNDHKNHNNNRNNNNRYNNRNRNNNNRNNNRNDNNNSNSNSNSNNSNNSNNNNSNNNSNIHPARVAAIANSRAEGLRNCLFNPCYNPHCGRNHEAGQAIRNADKWTLAVQLKHQGLCPQSHEAGICMAPACRLKHGKHGNGARCPTVEKNEICEQFFNVAGGGCRMSHKTR